MSNTGDNSEAKNTLFCSFCGKSQHEVKKLIAGPTVFICDECEPAWILSKKNIKQLKNRLMECLHRVKFVTSLMNM